MTLILREARQCDVSLLSELGVSTYTYHFKQYWTHSEELDEFLKQEYSQQVTPDQPLNDADDDDQPEQGMLRNRIITRITKISVTESVA